MPHRQGVLSDIEISDVATTAACDRRTLPAITTNIGGQNVAGAEINAREGKGP